MAYTSAEFLLVFLPIVLLVYQRTAKNWRWIVLLLAGYVYFYSFSGLLVFVLIGTTLFTYAVSVGLQRLEKENKKQAKRLLLFAILVLLGILAYLKYYNFFVQNVNIFMGNLGLDASLAARKLIVPIGISYYTLQAIGYLADVYWGKVVVEKRPWKLTLFLAFFPQIMEGPISMYSQTADALWEGKPITQKQLTDGGIRVLWGLFKKMVIADRLSVPVQLIFNNYQQYSGMVILAGAIFYTVQLYMEFSGCMDIVLGIGRMFGITLPENFRQPFASRSASEFWRRWHITLGVWFKTYVFYPVSVSKLVRKWTRFGKKHCGKYITKLGVSALALFPVWLGNGLWHGAQWNYLFYGMYYFVILMLEVALDPIKKKLPQIPFFAVAKTWIIIFTGEMFFRAQGVKAGFHMLGSIFQNFSLAVLWDGTFAKFRLDGCDYIMILAGLVLVAVVGALKERQICVCEKIAELKTPMRWCCYYALFFLVIIFGAYGVGYQKVDLIYAGF